MIKGIEKAREKGAFTLALTGRKGGKLAEVSEMSIRVNSDFTPIIQEVHIAIIHMICYSIDSLLE